MHKSKLGGFIIDCETQDLGGAAQFWAAALGMKLERLPDEEGKKYMKLEDPAIDLHVEVQKVKHPSRVHLDIETDNIAAEVARLESLGARRIEAVSTWTVMEAPTGQRFCVVKAGTAGFDRSAHTWT